MSRYEPNPAPRLRQTVAATGLLFALVVATLVAVSYPVAVVAALAGASVAAVTTVLALDVRRRTGRSRHVRPPGTDRDVEA